MGNKSRNAGTTKHRVRTCTKEATETSNVNFQNMKISRNQKKRKKEHLPYSIYRIVLCVIYV